MTFKNLSDIQEREIIPGYLARFIHSEKMTLAYWVIKSNSLLPEHSHKHEQVTVIISGKFELKVGNETKVLVKGDTAIIPSFVKHSGKSLTNCKIIDFFNPKREDYL